ncbi:hypothetical protein Tco_1571046 [Tanacetum coccineum]
MQRKILKNPYLICDIYDCAHEVDGCDQNKPPKQVCLSGGDIYDDPSLLRFYQNDDVSPWGNSRRKEKGESGPDWVVRRKFKDELFGFMFEKKFHTKGLGEMFDQHRKGIHEQFSQILSTIRKNKTPKPDAPTFAITTRSGTSTHDPPYPTSPKPMIVDHAEGTLKLIEPLEWKASENQLKSSMIEPPQLELKELPKHLEYAFLKEGDQLLVVISFVLSTTEKTKLH